MGNLDGKVAIVTGGGSGIGAATCRRLGEAGARVFVAEINEETGQAVAETIPAARFVATDVTCEQSVQALVAQVIDECGGIDILVNNAAVFVLRGIDASDEEWRRSLEVNVMGAARMARAVVPVMQDAGSGAIVNMGSISSFLAQPEFVTYNASKAAIAAMTRCLALDVAPHGIRVNAVCPGTVWTPVVEQMARDKGLDRDAAETHADFGGAHMLCRLAEPREIANAVCFLASDEASFITAECLMVDGGYAAK
ncbi:MAG: glucose 1-dehydrogenase [Planctomycetaceae bacterium]|jgi:dihydroanticapsin dehydrogenase|nr:glucose 1-dehydrogenase [Planctomycetaceae bacterium]